ncbi:MAG: hypothetical protein ACK59M_16900 [Pseudomonadota bacterium]|jgi:hypothetical protein
MPTESSFFLSQATYGLYLAISIALTVWVARVLTHTGETFLVRCFGHDADLARSTNRLLVIGFYLVNLGFISLRLGNWAPVPDDLVGELGARIGVTLLVLGGMHFFNMMMIARMGRTIRGWIANYNPGPEVSSSASPPPPLPSVRG